MKNQNLESIIPITGKKVAVVYCRVSTEDQKNNGLSIETQENLCTEEARKDGYSVLVVKDEGKSGGSIKGRPGMRQIIQMVLNKEIHALFVIHSDRLARNTADHLYLRDLFRKNNVVLKCINQPMTDDSAVSRTMDTMMA